jgi:hypothetical protein
MTETNAKIDAKTANLVDHLFDPNAKNVTLDLERLFKKLGNAHDRDPSTPLMRNMMDIVMLHHMSIDGEARIYTLREACKAIADEIDRDALAPAPPFHNRKHFMFMQLAGCAIDAKNAALYHQFKHEMRIPKLNDTDLACLMVARAMHDLGHPGGTNGGGDKYQPMKFENAAIERARPIFELNNVDPRDIKTIEMIVRATDPGMPHKIMMEAYNFHFNPYTPKEALYWDEMFKDFDEDTQAQLGELTKALFTDPKLCFMAACLCDSDTLPSFGVSKDMNYQTTVDLNNEFIENGLPPLLDDKGQMIPAGQAYALVNVVGTRPTEDGQHEANFRTPGAHHLGSAVARQLQLNAEEMLTPQQKTGIYAIAGIRLAA